jgi:hypothetical protein
MKINLFDTNGVHRNPVPGRDFSAKNIQLVFGQNNFDGITIFTDKHIVKRTSQNIKSKIKIAWIWEPECVYRQAYNAIEKFYKDYDLVFTHSDKLCKLSKNIKCVPTGTTWIPPEDRKIYNKSKKISTVISKKKYLQGHKLRHKIASVKGVQVFGNSVKYHPNKTVFLKDFMFSVAVENSSVKNYFTEKIVDCFLTGTVPVYWGCTNINNFFNKDGIILVNSAKELSNKIKYMNKEKYNQMLPAIEDNFNRALEYSNMFDWVYNKFIKK